MLSFRDCGRRPACQQRQLHDHVRTQGTAWYLGARRRFAAHRSEEHTSELQSLMRISYAVFCLKKKTLKHTKTSRSNQLTTESHPTSHSEHPNSSDTMTQ